MASRVLTWHLESNVSIDSETRIGPTYYMEEDYSPLAVRVNAEVAPAADVEFNIYDDGVTIFADTGSTVRNMATGAIISTTVDTNFSISAGETEELLAEDFKPDPVLKKGSWVYCTCIGGEGNFSVHLELLRISDED